MSYRESSADPLNVIAIRTRGETQFSSETEPRNIKLPYPALLSRTLTVTSSLISLYVKVFSGQSPHLSNGKSETFTRFQKRLQILSS